MAPEPSGNAVFWRVHDVSNFTVLGVTASARQSENRFSVIKLVYFFDLLMICCIIMSVCSNDDEEE